MTEFVMLNLNNQNIVSVNQDIADRLNHKGASKQDVLKLSFMVEEILLEYQKQFGADAMFEVNIKKRLLSDEIIIKVTGPGYDFRSLKTDMDIVQHLNADNRHIISWRYKNNCNNIVILPSVRKTVPAIVWILLAVLLAVGVSFLCRVLPKDIADFLCDTAVPGLYGVMYSILCMIAGLLIFFSTLSSIVHIGSIETLKSSLKRILTRSLLNSIGIIAVCSAAMCFFISDEGSAGSFSFSGIFQLLVNMIPRDIFTPFIEGNMMQIVVLSFVVGIVLLIIGRVGSGVLTFAETGTQVINFSMQVFCRFLPLFVFLNVFSVIPTVSSISFGEIGIPVIIGVLVVLLIMVIETAEVCLFHKIDMRSYTQAVMPGTIVCLSTASSSAAIDSIKKGMVTLDVDKEFVDFSLPLELVFYKPFAIIIVFISVLTVSQTMDYNLTGSIIAMVAVLALIIGFACPAVPGGMLSCLTVLTTQLSLPVGAMAVMILIATVFDYIGGALSVYSIQTEIVGLAHRCGKIQNKKPRT